MARPLRINYAGAFYHVTCRGNERKNIFADDRDRSMFLDKVKTSVAIYDACIHAYVLMSNPFHLIVETPKANLSEFMRHFNISYTAAYNRRHNRVGHLYKEDSNPSLLMQTITCWNSAATSISIQYDLLLTKEKTSVRR